MSSAWNALLNSAPELSQDLAKAQHQTIISPLLQYGVIAITGNDKATFCQGQFTNDVAKVSADQSQLSAFCSPKGRMLACFRLFCKEEMYYLRLPSAQLPSVLKRLRMFVLRAKVTLSDASEQMLGLGISGADADALMQSVLGISPPANINQALLHNGLLVLQVPGLRPRFELWGDAATIQTCWQSCHQQATALAPEVWDWLDIQAGIPDVYPATNDEFIPQMANLDQLDAISFAKGCYVGQEIVARMHYLGRLKRRMFRLWLNTDTPPTPGTDLFAPELRGEQSIGKIVRASPNPAGGSDALAVLVLDCAEGSLQLANSDSRIEQRSLPYSLDSK